MSCISRALLPSVTKEPTKKTLAEHFADAAGKLLTQTPSLWEKWQRQEHLVLNPAKILVTLGCTTSFLCCLRVRAYPIWVCHLMIECVLHRRLRCHQNLFLAKSACTKKTVWKCCEEYRGSSHLIGISTPIVFGEEHWGFWSFHPFFVFLPTLLWPTFWSSQRDEGGFTWVRK